MILSRINMTLPYFFIAVFALALRDPSPWVAVAFRSPVIHSARNGIRTGSLSSSCRLLTSANALVGPSDELMDLFNKQVTQEFIASQVYLSASIWFDQNDWEGMAAYMLAESAEERQHGLGFVDFANKRNIPIELQVIPAPVSYGEWSSPEDVWKSILELEQANTRSLLNLAEAANACHDFAVMAFLNPFHLQQVNEEDKIGSIIAKVTDENRTPGLLRSLDVELGGEAET
mmetsp:Transcript_28893/g.78284  ORF Transcript_28893/g.78284 Transcript_28893/m.78284 type:complete len:231 (-) Transcript_28893:1801-2493(-)